MASRLKPLLYRMEVIHKAFMELQVCYVMLSFPGSADLESLTVLRLLLEEEFL